jgi:hypothetical protein
MVTRFFTVQRNPGIFSFYFQLKMDNGILTKCILDEELAPDENIGKLMKFKIKCIFESFFKESKNRTLK